MSLGFLRLLIVLLSLNIANQNKDVFAIRSINEKYNLLDDIVSEVPKQRQRKKRYGKQFLFCRQKIINFFSTSEAMGKKYINVDTAQGKYQFRGHVYYQVCHFWPVNTLFYFLETRFTEHL